MKHHSADDPRAPGARAHVPIVNGGRSSSFADDPERVDKSATGPGPVIPSLPEHSSNGSSETTDAPAADGDAPADESEPATDTMLVTFFKNKAAATLGVENLTLKQLADRIAGESGADKARLPLLKLARFGDKRTDRNCLRHDANVIEFGGIESEHDAGTMTFAAALETVQEANIRALLYTSPSYVPEEKERWRILLPMSKTYPPEKRADFVAWVNGLFGGAIASESFTLSQPFYYGHIGGWQYRIEITEGDFLDLRDDLKADAIGKPIKGAKGRSKSGGGSGGLRRQIQQQRHVRGHCAGRSATGRTCSEVDRTRP